MNQKKSILLILSITLLNVMGVSIIIPILPLLSKVFELSPQDLGLIIACFSLPSAFFTPISGFLADMYGRKKILIFGLILFSIGGVGCALSSSFIQLITFRVVQGLGSAPLGVLYGTLIGDIYPEHDRPKMMGMTGATISIGIAIYPAIGGFVGNIHWSLPFWFSLLAIPICLLALQFSYQKIQTQPNIKTYLSVSKSIILNSYAIGLFSITFLGFSILYGPTLTYLPLLTSTLYNATPSEIGIVFSIASFGTTIIAMSLAKLVKTYSHRKLLLFSAFCYLTSQALIILLPIQNRVLWFLCIPIFILGVAQGITFPLINSRLTSLCPSSNRAIIMAINGTIMRTSQSISPLFFGLGWTLLGWKGPFVGGICIAIILAMVILNTFPNTKETIVYSPNT